MEVNSSQFDFFEPERKLLNQENLWIGKMLG